MYREAAGQDHISRLRRLRGEEQFGSHSSFESISNEAAFNSQIFLLLADIE